jgi:hypothetical protein
MPDVRNSLSEAILEILEAIYAGKPTPEVDRYIHDRNITREQLAAAAITSMILERYSISPAT